MDAPSPPSPDGTRIITGFRGNITDGSGNAWTITADRRAAVNGVPDKLTAGVILLAWIGNKIWQQSDHGLWWCRTSTGGWFPAGGTATSPFGHPAPSPARHLQATAVRPTSITLQWQPPSSGAGPYIYSVQMLQSGSTNWSTAKVTRDLTTALIRDLTPNTSYNFQVVTICV